MQKTAVVLFNLGGPDSLDAVEPFLYNLFSDPAIIGLPSFLRLFIARRISRKRAPIAQEIYRHMGGRSPICEETQKQAIALEKALDDLNEVKVFVAMRHWHPRSNKVANEVKDYNPNNLVLLPLYPQFSTTTTRSSLIEWHREATRTGLVVPNIAISTLCCYPIADGLIDAQSKLIAPLVNESATGGPVRLLLSAHGLPERIVKKGDPYVWQVEQTAARIAERLGIEDLDWKLCYQSRVGPMKWTGPATDDEIRRAGTEGRGLVVAPIAFVSEHSETLVELDIEYRKLAEESGVPSYRRAPAVGCHPAFIGALADLVRKSIKRVSGKEHNVFSLAGGRICPSHHSGCPLSAG